jgi:hypothetical protein
MLVAIGASANDIYRWTDNAGRTHMSDRVPEEYRSRAVRLGAGPGQTAAEKEAAATRARRDAERLKAFEAARNTEDARGVEQARAAASASAAASAAGAARRQAETATKAVCDQLFAAYLASDECWGRYRLNSRAVRGEEALQACGEPIADPSRRCGTVVPPASTVRTTTGG